MKFLKGITKIILQQGNTFFQVKGTESINTGKYKVYEMNKSKSLPNFVQFTEFCNVIIVCIEKHQNLQKLVAPYLTRD